MNELQTMVRTVTRLEVSVPEAHITLRHHVWQTPIARRSHAIQDHSTTAWSKLIPVWVYVAARRILGEGFYMRIRSALRGEG